MIAGSCDASSPCGVVRLFNTASGRVLCLAGEVGAEVVDAFLVRYGREPVRIDGIDARSAISLSAAALDLVRDHLDAADRASRTVTIRPARPVQLLADRRTAGT